jgi:hypothetical protein
MNPNILWDEQYVDWEPLKAVVGEEGLGAWMWMHRCDCPDNGAAVHFYKHSWSRRYLRLDADGRVYREARDGTPVPLAACGGAALVLLLIRACAQVRDGLPATIRLPEAAREPCTVADLPELLGLLLNVEEEFTATLEAVAPAPPGPDPTCN